MTASTRTLSGSRCSNPYPALFMKRPKNGIVVQFRLPGNEIAAVISGKTETRDH